MTEEATFAYYVIISRLRIREPEIEMPSRLVVVFSVKKDKINITKSRINVSEFNYVKGNEFSGKVSEFRSVIGQGFPLQVRYRGKPVGAATARFSKEFVESIDPKMDQSIQTVESPIKQDGGIVGNLELKLMIVPKCEEPKGGAKQEYVLGFLFSNSLLIPSDFLSHSPDQTCRNIDTSIKPTDIFFTVGDKQICQKPLEKAIDKPVAADGDQRLELDLERYKRLPQERLVAMPEEPFGVAVCDELKNMTLQYGRIIDLIVQQVRNQPSPLPDDDARFIDWSDKRKAYKESFKFPVLELNDPHKHMEYVGFCPSCLSSVWWLPHYTIYRIRNDEVVPNIN